MHVKKWLVCFAGLVCSSYTYANVDMSPVTVSAFNGPCGPSMVECCSWRLAPQYPCAKTRCQPETSDVYCDPVSK